MAETVLPGVSIEVRDEGLIVPTAITVGNLGVVGTASKGPVDQPVILASYAEARARFGEYDLWQGGTADELTLTRALELAFQHGATTAIAVRVSEKDNDPQRTILATSAERALTAGAATPVKLTAKPPAPGATISKYGSRPRPRTRSSRTRTFRACSWRSKK
jgi:hypothetical protein